MYETLNIAHDLVEEGLWNDWSMGRYVRVRFGTGRPLADSGTMFLWEGIY